MNTVKCFQFVLFIILTFTVQLRESARVLGLFPTWSRSHLIIEMAVIQTLVDRGHNVTVVTSLPLKDENPKYQHVQLADAEVPADFFVNTIESHKSLWNVIQSGGVLFDFGMNASIKALTDPKMQKLMRDESFDLVVLGYFLNEFHVGVAAHFQCPLIIVDTHKPMLITNWWVGNPVELFSVPAMLSSKSQPLSFFDRVENVALNLAEAAFVSVATRRIRSIYNDFFPLEKYPPYDQMVKNISLILHTSHFSERPIRPLVPGFVQIGGVQVKPTPDPLPQDIQSHMDSPDGAILISMGSNAKSSDLNPEVMQIIFNTVSKLKQKVIWKWESTNYPGKSPNILYKKWLPQDDILAHPKMRLFISHCGLGAVVEAQYHGVPIVGMPLYADQFSNAKAYEDAGFGIRVDYHGLTETVFQEAVLEVLENSKYIEKVKEFSQLYRDRPTNARDTAAYWMEYVIRHKGAKHMQSPAVHMCNIAYLGLDVLGFLLLTFYVVFKTIKAVFAFLLAIVCRRKSSIKRKNE